MNWLLWKDYRQNRLVVLAALFFLLTPHLIALFACCRWHYDSPKHWIESFAISSIYGLIISQLAIVLVGGNAIAGERADRSAEFLVSLPISRSKILASKIIFSLAIIAVIWLTDASALAWLANLSHIRPDSNEIVEILGYTAITSAVMFSVAWCLSSFLASPTFAVCGGLLTPVLLWSSFSFVGYLFQIDGERQFWDFAAFLYCCVCLTLSPICFGVGTWHYLRRVEP